MTKKFTAGERAEVKIIATKSKSNKSLITYKSHTQRANIVIKTIATYLALSFQKLERLALEIGCFSLFQELAELAVWNPLCNKTEL